MSTALAAVWTVETFLDWVVRQEGRFEFDGSKPVAMTGDDLRHNQVMTNIHAALRSRLRRTPCRYYGSDVGVRIPSGKVRYPDALVTCTRAPDSALLAPDVVAVFEVLSPTSARTDRIEKVREYGSVPSMRAYVIVETRPAEILVLRRASTGQDWTAIPVELEDVVELATPALAIPASEIYEDVDFDEG